MDSHLLHPCAPLAAGRGGNLAAWIYGGGVLGALLSGYLADAIAERTNDRRWYAWLSGVCTAAILPFSFLVYLSTDPMTALIVQIAVTALMHVWIGPVYGTIQSLAGAKRRAIAVAVNLLTVNLIAYGMGPLLIGVASDFFSSRFGNESLRFSIPAVIVVSYAWAAAHFFLAAPTLRQDLKAAEAEDGAAVAR